MKRAIAAVSRSNGKRSLSPRQEKVLHLVIDGLTNREIAEQLQISVRTVEVHRFNLMRRLRASNVAQLLRAALREGVLSRGLLTARAAFPASAARRVSR